VPYCVGSVLLSAADNKMVNIFGKLQPAINAVSEAKLNALRNVANDFNSTLNRVKRAVENQCHRARPVTPARLAPPVLLAQLALAVQQESLGFKVPVCVLTLFVCSFYSDACFFPHSLFLVSFLFARTSELCLLTLPN